MCGRVAVPETKDILKEFSLIYKGDEWTKNINLKPTDPVPVIASNKPNELDLVASSPPCSMDSRARNYY